MQIALPKSVYSVEVINRAAYSSALYGSILITEKDNFWEVELCPINKGEIEEFKNEFQSRLTDESLREVIRSRTDNLRSLILAHAYSNTRIADEDPAS